MSVLIGVGVGVAVPVCVGTPVGVAAVVALGVGVTLGVLLGASRRRGAGLVAEGDAVGAPLTAIGRPLAGDRQLHIRARRHVDDVAEVGAARRLRSSASYSCSAVSLSVVMSLPVRSVTVAGTLGFTLHARTGSGCAPPAAAGCAAAVAVVPTAEYGIPYCVLTLNVLPVTYHVPAPLISSTIWRACVSFGVAACG